VRRGARALAVACLLAFAGLAGQPAAAHASAGSCLQAQTALAQVTAGGKTGPVAGSIPVIFVHGILSSPATWKPDTPGSLAWQTATTPGVTAWTFDYAHRAEDWVTNPVIGPALAQAIGCLASVSGHQVLVVAHSMGGLATQYAMGMPDSSAAGHVGEMITLGTPYTGSQILSDMESLVHGGDEAAAFGGDPEITAFAEALLSACAGIATHTDSNPCSVVSVLDAPVGTALDTNSAAIKALPPLPATLPVLDIAGNMDLLVGVGSLGVHVHPGDIAVMLPSATAHNTTSTPFVLSCSTTLPHALGAPCFHSDLMNAPSVIARVLSAIRAYRAGVPSTGTGSGAGGQTPYTSTLTGFTPAAQLSHTWNERIWDGDTYQDSLSVTSVQLTGDSLTLSYTAQHSGVSSALSEGTSDACLVLPGDYIEEPSAATPGSDAPPLTGNGSYSGTLTFPVLSPGSYVLSWGCQSLDPNNSSENITLGTATGASVGAPQVDEVYGGYVWYVTGVSYTGSRTTVNVTVISNTSEFTTPSAWTLSPQSTSVGAGTIQANSVVDRTVQSGISGSTGEGGNVTQLTVTFPTGQHGLYFDYTSTLSTNEYVQLP
jgi:pimeloyl-ACP methyl ester carboxylesterase